MAGIGVYGSSTARGLHDFEMGGFAERLKVAYMQRYAQDPKHNRLVHVYNRGVCAQLIDETIKTIEEDDDRKNRQGHKGRRIAVTVLGSMESALDKHTGEPKISRLQFRNRLHALGAMMAERKIEPIYLGPTPIDDTMTHPFVNENGPSDYFDTGRRFHLAEDIEEYARETGKPYIDLWQPLGGYYPREAGTLAFDGLHANPEGHRRIAELVLPEADLLIYGHPWRTGPEDPPPEDTRMLEAA